MSIDPRNLRIPGPTPVPPRVMEAMQQPMVPHRGGQFSEVFHELQQQLKRIHRTEHEVFVIAGTGSAGWEASLVNTMNQGERVLALINGNFGERFCIVAQSLGIEVVRLDVEWGKVVRPEDVKAALDANPDVRAVMAVQNETSTGVLNPIQDIARVVREHEKLFFVDAVSGLPGAQLDMDDWQCDIVFSASQKAFMCPPGLSIIAVGERVWPQVERSTMPRYMLDLTRMRQALANGTTPSTAPISLIYGLKAACDMLEEEGMDNVFERHIKQGEYVRNEIKRMGLNVFAESGFESPTVTAISTPEGITAGQVVKAMNERHGIHIATSQGPIQDSVIRIGHMGWSDYPELERTLQALDDVLEHIPAKVAASS